MLVKESAYNIGDLRIVFQETTSRLLIESVLEAIRIDGTIIDREYIQISEDEVSRDGLPPPHIHILAYKNEYVYIYKWTGTNCMVLKYKVAYCYQLDCDWAGLKLVSTSYMPICPN